MRGKNVAAFANLELISLADDLKWADWDLHWSKPPLPGDNIALLVRVGQEKGTLGVWKS